MATELCKDQLLDGEDNAQKCELATHEEKRYLSNFLSTALTKLSGHILPCIPRRHLVCMFLCTGLMFGLAMRVNISVALVAMVSNTTKDIVVNGTKETVLVKPAEFDWDVQTQGLILGAFFYTYTPATIPCGYLGSRFGGHKLFGFGNLLVALLSFLIPIAARIDRYALVGVRLLQGPCQALLATTYPSIISLWMPPNERCKMTAIVVAGYTAGIVTGTMLAGVIAENFGWDVVFYAFGGASLFWCLMYFWLVSPCPEKDLNISKVELEFIQASFSKYGEDDRHVRAKRVPWFKIATSLPFLAICSNFMCHSWGIFTLINGLPLYFKNVLNFNIEESGIMTSVPFAAQMIVGPLTGKMADCLLEKKLMSTTKIRKLCCCLGFTIEGLFFLLIANYNEWKALLAGLIIAFCLGGIATNPIAVNHIDIAPRYASLLLGILNGISCLMGICSPLVMSILTPNQTESEWRVLFFVTTGMYGLGVIVYAIFGSAEKQPWAEETIPDEIELGNDPLLVSQSTSPKVQIESKKSTESIPMLT